MSSSDRRTLNLPKRLGALSLTGLHLILVFNVLWCGVGARQGSSNACLWLLGMITYYLPVALIVGHLSKAMPLEGGPYQWVRLSFGPCAGFITAVNFFVFLITVSAGTGLVTVDTVSYLFPSTQTHIAESYFAIAIVHVGLISIACWINIRGFQLMKWITNSAALLNVTIGALLIGTLFLSSPGNRKGAFLMTLPPLTMASFNIFTKITFNALGGLEQAAIFSGESHAPERNVARSVCFAAPGIAVLYVLGTSAILAHVSPKEVDLAAPVAQVAEVSLANRPYAAWIAILAAAILPIVVSIVNLGEAARLPLVAAWDNAIPSMLGKVDKRHGTPVNAILLSTILSLALGLASRIASRTQEANQLLLGGAFACCGIYNLLFLAVPLLGFNRLSGVPRWLRLVTIPPLVVTIAATIFQAVSLVPVGDRRLFGLKICMFVIAVNLGAMVLYVKGSRQAVSRQTPQDLAPF